MSRDRVSVRRSAGLDNGSDPGASRLLEALSLSSSRLLERTFVEVRRRTKVIGRIPGETSAVALIRAVLELASRGWRGVTMTPRAVVEFERLRRGPASQSEPDRSMATEEVIAA